MKRVALIGECMVELNGKPFGNLIQKYGGDSLNTAVYMSRTSGKDIRIDYVTAMGTDPLSQAMTEKWMEEGISTDLVMLDKERSPGLYHIQLDDSGERSFTYWRGESAARFMVGHPDFGHVIRQLMAYDMVYISGISIAILPEEDRCTLIRELKKLSRLGVKVVFDSNYRPNLWKSEELARASYELMYALSDIALVTDEDEQSLWKDADLESTVSRLRNSGLKELVIKRGASGCDYYHFPDDMQEFIPANKVDKVVDTTSAGDAFNAGYMLGMLNGKEPYVCALQGHKLASLVIQHPGAIIPRDVSHPLFRSMDKYELYNR